MSPEERSDRETAQEIFSNFRKSTEVLMRIGGNFKNLEMTRKEIHKSITTTGTGIPISSAFKEFTSQIFGSQSGIIGSLKSLREETNKYQNTMSDLQSKMINPTNDIELQSLIQQRDALHTQNTQFGLGDPSQSYFNNDLNKMDQAIASRKEEISIANEATQSEMGGMEAAGGAAMAHPAAMVALAVVAALQKLFNEFMGPGLELSKSLKSAGMPKLVNAFNIAAEPLVQIMDLITQMFVPVFMPMMETITKAVIDKIPAIQDKIQKLSDSGLFETVADSAVKIVDHLPDMLEIWTTFAGLNWGITIETVNMMLPLIKGGLDAVNFVMNLIYNIVKTLTDFGDEAGKKLKEGWDQFADSVKAGWDRNVKQYETFKSNLIERGGR